MEKDFQFTRICEHAMFVRRVSFRMSYRTIPDVDDGFGDRTPACREYTLVQIQIPEFMPQILHREDSNSRSVAKEREPGSATMEPSSSIQETPEKQFEIQTNPVYNYTEEGIPIEERKRHDSPAFSHVRGQTFEAQVSKLVMR